MTKDDFEDFRAFLSEALAFWGKDVSRFTLDVWWQAMLPFDLVTVQQAFSRHAMNPDAGQFAPKPADVMKMLGGTTNDRALSAWAKVDRALRVVGPYRSVAFDDPLIHRVLADMGGWTALANKRDDEWPFVAKEFETRYRGFAMRGERPEYPGVLVGISEHTNSAEGKRSAPPMLIGSPDRARKVIDSGVENIAGLLQITQAAPALLEANRG